MRRRPSARARRFDSTYEGLKLGPDTVIVISTLGFDSTYEGLKLWPRCRRLLRDDAFRQYL